MNILGWNAFKLVRKPSIYFKFYTYVLFFSLPSTPRTLPTSPSPASTCPAHSPSSYMEIAMFAPVWKSVSINLCTCLVKNTSLSPSSLTALFKVGFASQKWVLKGINPLSCSEWGLLAKTGSGSRGVICFVLITRSPRTSPGLTQSEASWCVSALLQVDDFHIRLLACSQIICLHDTINLTSKYCPIGDLIICFFNMLYNPHISSSTPLLEIHFWLNILNLFTPPTLFIWLFLACKFLWFHQQMQAMLSKTKEWWGLSLVSGLFDHSLS